MFNVHVLLIHVITKTSPAEDHLVLNSILEKILKRNTTALLGMRWTGEAPISFGSVYYWNYER